MSWGVALRNALALGLGGIVSLTSGKGETDLTANLATEAGANLVQEDGGLILL
jgi:hypothetical protein